MPPKNGDYIPTLAVRPSEMNGLEFLPGLSKDKMVPVILLAPWSSARSLEKAMERVGRAFPHRRFFLDVDRDYRPTDSEIAAQAQWLELRNPADRFQAWRKFWIDYPEVMPCLQIEKQFEDDIKSQIEGIQEQGREFCLRIELKRMSINIHNIQAAIDALIDIGTADFMVVIEGGWVRDALMMYAEAHGLISGMLSNLDGRVPITVSCTTIPKEFHEFEGLVETPFQNHQLLNQIRRGTNRETVLFGDWGSTKPREDASGRTPLPRIDFPTREAWYTARSKKKNWGYQKAAEVIVNSPFWTHDLGIWGEEMIEGTATNPAFAIDTPQKNVAARVNIHLHRQALFDQDIRGIDLDEDWVD
jgi:hypothetical protein